MDPDLFDLPDSSTLQELRRSLDEGLLTRHAMAAAYQRGGMPGLFAVAAEHRRHRSTRSALAGQGIGAHPAP